MDTVSFPEMNLNFNISKVAFSVMGLDVSWYGIIIVFAILIVLLFCKKDDSKYNVKFEDIINMFLIILPLGLIGARLYYVIFEWDLYKNNLVEILNIRDGGLAIYGGLIAGVIGILIYAKKKRKNFLDFLDYIAPYIPLAQAIGRIGNFINVEAYGAETTSFWRMKIAVSSGYKEVHPTFLYEAVGNLIIFILLYNLRNRRKFKGQLTYIYVVLYSLIRFFVEGLRVDSLMIGNFRVSQLISIILSVLGLLGYIFSYKYKNAKKKNNVTK